MSAMAERLEAVREEIRKRASETVRILAVTKTQPVEAILALAPLGITEIGENRVQEWREKREALGDRFAVSLIGPLQQNKINAVFGKVALIQSVDSAKLVEAMQKRAPAGSVQDILLQVNIGRESQKSGAMLEDVQALTQNILQSPSLRLRGLMAIMPIAEASELRPLFRSMRRAFEEIQHHVPCVDILSMGMSQDYIPALDEGSTMIRLGSALFGPRASHPEV